jgi:hypothetical protein
VTELPKSSPEPASSKEPIVFVTDDDASMRRAVPVGNLNRLQVRPNRAMFLAYERKLAAWSGRCWSYCSSRGPRWKLRS